MFSLINRYSDFMVHEIALDGSLVQLDNLTPPLSVRYMITFPLEIFFE